MPDLPEDSWMKSHYATHEDLEAESAAIVKALRKEHAKDMDVIRDQLSYLQKTHTVALMAATLYTQCDGYDHSRAAIVAKQIYREVEKTLEIDRQITGQIPAA